MLRLELDKGSRNTASNKEGKPIDLDLVQLLEEIIQLGNYIASDIGALDIVQSIILDKIE